MEQLYTNGKIGKAWLKEAKGNSGNLWWFDLDDQYEPGMRLGGDSPIVCNDEAIEECDCWDTLGGASCILLLRHQIKTVVGIVHEKGGGLRFYSQVRAHLNKAGNVVEDAPGVFMLLLPWSEYAQLGLIRSTKKYLRGAFKPEAVMVDPKVSKLFDYSIGWLLDSAISELGDRRVETILKGVNDGRDTEVEGHSQQQGI